MKSLLCAALTLWCFSQLAPRLLAATAGTSISIFGQPGALAYDPNSKLLFISNTSQNLVEVYSQTQNQVVASVPVGQGPLGIAVISGSNVVLVCNTKDTYLSIIGIASLTQTGTIPVTSQSPFNPEYPFSIVALSDGSALISTNLGLQRVDVAGRKTTPVQTTQFQIPPNSLLTATGDGKLVFGQGAGTAFLYNPGLTQVFERFRGISSSSVIAADQSGQRFMIGDSQLDRQLSQTSEINPFSSPSAPIGGVAFHPDGSRIFVGYNQSPGAEIDVVSATDLKLLTSFRVPEAITGMMLISPDGNQLFAISASGITAVDLSALASLPSVQVSSKVLHFSFQSCNLAPLTQTLQITNAGGGTFSWNASSSSSSVALDSSTGNGPTTLQVTVNPSGLAFRGTALLGTIKITSDESVSGDQTVSVFVNVTTPDQVGSVFPIDGFISDILVDDARQRVYLVNSSKDEIDVFSIAQQTFLSPVPVGSIPKSIAFSSDKNTLLVTNLGAEYITEINAGTLAPTGTIRIPAPAPNNPVGTHPFSIIQAANGVTLFVAATTGSSPSGTVYQLNFGSLTPVPLSDLGTTPNGTVPNAVDGLTFAAASGNGSFVLLAETRGILHLYDTGSGNFAVTRSMGSTIAGNVAASADGSYYHADKQMLSNVLVPDAVIPSTLPGSVLIAGFAFAPAGTGAYRGVRPPTVSANSPAPAIEKVDAAGLNVLSEFNIAEGLAPGSRSIFSAVPRELAVNSTETTLYGISDSGLIVIPLPGSSSTAGPQIYPGGIVNGASFAPSPAPVAPGSIAAIFGSNLSKSTASPDNVPLPSVLGGTCVTIDGIPAPLFYVSPGQVNVQIPWELAGKSSAQVALGSDTLSTQPVTVNLSSQSPGIFTLSGNGQGAGAILHSSDYSVVSASNPATVGEVVLIYATGLGPVSPTLGSGQAAPSDGSLYRTSTPTVTIGGANATVLFSGLAPGFVGLDQVDARIPSNAPVGTNVPIAITMGTQTTSQATIAVVPAH